MSIWLFEWRRANQSKQRAEHATIYLMNEIRISMPLSWLRSTHRRVHLWLLSTSNLEVVFMALLPGICYTHGIIIVGKLLWLVTNDQLC